MQQQQQQQQHPQNTMQQPQWVVVPQQSTHSQTSNQQQSQQQHQAAAIAAMQQQQQQQQQLAMSQGNQIHTPKVQQTQNHTITPQQQEMEDQQKHQQQQQQQQQQLQQQQQQSPRKSKESERRESTIKQGQGSPQRKPSEAQGTGDQTPSIVEKFPAVFAWTHGGRDVYVVYSGDGWSQKHRMHRSHNDFTLIMDISPGVYHYKFVVDNQWRCAPNQVILSRFFFGGFFCMCGWLWFFFCMFFLRIFAIITEMEALYKLVRDLPYPTCFF